MEISFDTIIAILGLFIGGGGGAFFTWRWQRRKAKAEANKEEQDYYQQMMADLAKDRDYYKQDRDEQRERFDKLSRNVIDWKRTTDETIDDLRRKVARNGRQIEMMRPFMCGDMKCKKRVHVTSLEGVEAKPADIEPIDNKDL